MDDLNMGAVRFCTKCAQFKPHPFRHWHIRCPMCRIFTVFRGPACKSCLEVGREIMRTILKEGQ